jgi:BirA family biotin operon repressor/biotin-[acetyl-CoA-carboxylase] ligase
VNNQENRYRLTSPALSIDDIKAEVKGSIGREFFFYEIVGSTNTIAAELAEKGEAEGAVVIANSQEKGRGRLARGWVSPPDVNIYMSIILRPEIEPKEITVVTLMAAVGCTIALRRVTGLKVTIKWPNDLMASDKKLGGILTELRMASKKVKYAITGIGINVNMDSEAFPDNIKELATSLKIETGLLHSRTEIIIETLNEIGHWYLALKEKRMGEVLSEWQRLTSTIGRKVKINLGRETLTGTAESIDNVGRLFLRLPSGELKAIRVGDLTVLE